MIIRPIEIDDVQACAEIVKQNWNEEVARRFTAEVSHVWSQDMDNPPMYFVATQYRKTLGNEIIVGVAGCARNFQMQGAWDLVNVAVNPSFHGQGIGKALTLHRIRKILEADGRYVCLVTQKDKYFEQFGFTVSRDFLGVPPREGWKLMTLQLGPVTF
jgi:predicted N-acetyltransferase YhbS